MRVPSLGGEGETGQSGDGGAGGKAHVQWETTMRPRAGERRVWLCAIYTCSTARGVVGKPEYEHGHYRPASASFASPPKLPPRHVLTRTGYSEQQRVCHCPTGHGSARRICASHSPNPRRRLHSQLCNITAPTLSYLSLVASHPASTCSLHARTVPPANNPGEGSADILLTLLCCSSGIPLSSLQFMANVA